MNIAEWRAHRVVPQVLRHFLYLNFLGALAGSKIGWHFIIHEYYWAVHLKKQASNFFTVLRLGSGMGLGLWWWWWLWLWFWLWLWVLEWEPPYRWLQRDLHRQLFPHRRRQCRWAQRTFNFDSRISSSLGTSSSSSCFSESEVSSLEMLASSSPQLSSCSWPVSSASSSLAF